MLPKMLPKVLVVDDEEVVIRAIKKELEAKGYQVFCAHSGHEAIKQATLHHPEIALIDLVMPNLDGAETCAELIKLNDQIVNICFTGAFGSENTSREVRFAQAGGQVMHHLYKPFSEGELLNVVRKVSKWGHT
jgi:CheY-like chemotaxis protein